MRNIPFGIERAPRAPFEQCRIGASKTADAAWRAIRKIETYDSSPVIATRQREVTLTYRKPTEAQVESALRLLELTREEREAIHKKTTNYARHTIRFAEPESPGTEDVIVQAFRIGDQAVVSMPFEVLVEIGLEIKKKSPAPRTFLIELANDSYGYLPPRRTRSSWAATRPGWEHRGSRSTRRRRWWRSCWRCSGSFGSGEGWLVAGGGSVASCGRPCFPTRSCAFRQELLPDPPT